MPMRRPESQVARLQFYATRGAGIPFIEHLQPRMQVAREALQVTPSPSFSSIPAFPGTTRTDVLPQTLQCICMIGSAGRGRCVQAPDSPPQRGGNVRSVVLTDIARCPWTSVCSRARRWMFVFVCVPIGLSAASKNTGMCQTARVPPCRCTRQVDALVMPTLTWPAREVDCAAITADGAAAGVSIYQYRGRAASSGCGGMLVKEASVTALLRRRALRRASPQHWRLAAPRQWAMCSTHMQPSATRQVLPAVPGADRENQPYESLTQTPPQLWDELGSRICPLCRAQF